MLYKKIHRQYLREFRVGRRFMVWDKVYKMARKPYIDGSYIIVRYVIYGEEEISYDALIPMTGEYSGQLCTDIIADVGRVERLRCCIRRFIDNFLENLR